MEISIRQIMYALGIVGAIIVSVMAMGFNEAGHRTVYQLPSGSVKVKFEAGPYFNWFGPTWEYNDVVTFDFDKTQNAEGATIDQEGISVRYQDGGTGTIYGIARFRLPSDEASMLSLHREFRSNFGIAHKLIKNTTEEIINHTAGLMSSEESYAEKRGTFSEWVKDQLNNGKYATTQKQIITTETGFEFCLQGHLTDLQEKECKNIKKTTKVIPVVAYVDGLPSYLNSDLKQYGIERSGFNVVDWGYEKKTLDQISDKRAATMAIITSKANAERAKQDAITAEQQGLANVMQARYEKEVLKEQAVVDAERAKEVAVIAAEQLVEVATQEKLEAEQRKLAAAETKQQQILLGQGEAERKRLVMQADGALQQKLDAYVKAQNYWATAYRDRAVPQIIMGNTGGAGSDTDASQFQSMLNAMVAKDLMFKPQVSN